MPLLPGLLGGVLTRRAAPRLQLIAHCCSVEKIYRGEKAIQLGRLLGLFP